MITVETELDRRQDELMRMEAENALLDRQADAHRKSMMEMAEKLDIAQEALLFLEEVANSRRGVMKERIEKIVTDALRLVYGPEYSIEMEYSMKNNRSSLDIRCVKKTKSGDVKRKLGGFGLGVADTISVPMRLMVALGSKQTDRVVGIDEPYKHVDPDRVELVGEFLRAIAHQLGVQIIMCSHHEVMRSKADKAYHVSLGGGEMSEIEEA